MSDSREFNASTVDKALRKASQELDVPEADLSYEVIDSGSDGFLGIGARDARVIVSFETQPSQSIEAENDGIVSIADPAEDEPESFSSAPVEPPPSESLSVPAPSSSDDETGDSDEGSNDAPPLPAASDHLIEEVEQYVSSVMDAMGLGARLDVYDTDEYIAVDIASDHTALIIGQKGETIDSLQYLVNSAIYRDREFVKRIVLDSEGYRQRRIEAIQGMAHRTARKSIREDRDIKMPPMNSSERRVVHVYLKDNPDVTTFSEGSGNDRRVTVSPN